MKWKNLQDILLGDKSKLQNSICKHNLFLLKKEKLIYRIENSIWRHVHWTANSGSL